MIDYATLQRVYDNSEEVYVYCATFDEAKALLDVLDRIGYRWPGDHGRLSEYTNFEYYGESVGVRYHLYPEYIVRISDPRDPGMSGVKQISVFLPDDEQTEYDTDQMLELIKIMSGGACIA